MLINTIWCDEGCETVLETQVGSTPEETAMQNGWAVELVSEVSNYQRHYCPACTRKRRNDAEND